MTKPPSVVPSKIQVGETVQYCYAGDREQPRAAMVTKVHPDGTCALVVFVPGATTPHAIQAVAFADKVKDGCFNAIPYFTEHTRMAAVKS